MVRTRVVQPSGSQVAQHKPTYLLRHYHSWLPSAKALGEPARVRRAPVRSDCGATGRRYQYWLYDARHDVRTLVKEAIGTCASCRGRSPQC